MTIEEITKEQIITDNDCCRSNFPTKKKKPLSVHDPLIFSLMVLMAVRHNIIGYMVLYWPLYSLCHILLLFGL